MNSPQVTELLARADAGDSQARDRLFDSVYEELRALARGYLRNERPGHTLQATALVNEVCLRLLSGERLPGKNRAQFRAFVAKAMRHVLVDYSRGRRRAKRGGKDQRRVPLSEDLVVGRDSTLDFLALDEALERLEAVDPRKSRVVELRYFGGMSFEEVAAALDVSLATATRDWNVAKAWLLAELSKGETGVE